MFGLTNSIKAARHAVDSLLMVNRRECSYLFVASYSGYTLRLIFCSRSKYSVA